MKLNTLNNNLKYLKNDNSNKIIIEKIVDEVLSKKIGAGVWKKLILNFIFGNTSPQERDIMLEAIKQIIQDKT